MHLEIHPPLLAMEAKSVDSVPLGDEWQYEPKWDSFLRMDLALPKSNEGGATNERSPISRSNLCFEGIYNLLRL